MGDILNECWRIIDSMYYSDAKVEYEDELSIIESTVKNHGWCDQTKSDIRIMRQALEDEKGELYD